MFNIRRPSAAAIKTRIAAAGFSPDSFESFLPADAEGVSPRIPFSFARDSSSSFLGTGDTVFAAARRAFRQWTMFDLGWVRVANAAAQIVPGQLVVVEAHTLGLWTLNLSRILEVVDAPLRFGFVYGTTDLHVEEGAERFFLEFDRDSGAVSYKLEAVSRPRSPLARLGFPITRMYQHRFARDSHRRMRDAVSGDSAVSNQG